MAIIHNEKNIELLKTNFYKELDSYFKTDEVIQWNIESFKKMFNSYLTSLLKTEFEIFMDQHEYNNSANGYSKKIIKTVYGEIEISVPRDRKGEFNSEILTKYSSSTEELSKVILQLFQFGLSHNDVCSFIDQIYGVKYSRQTISTMTKVCDQAVMEFNQIKLNNNYIALFLDATYIPIKFDKSYELQALHLVVGINTLGYQEILSYTIGYRENLTLWAEALDDIKKRGVENIDVIVSDGFVGMNKIIKSRLPNTKVQRCTVHILRNIIDKEAKKDVNAMTAEFGSLFKMTDIDGFNIQLDFLKQKYSKYKGFLDSTFEDQNITTYLSFPVLMHRTIRTTNRIEAVNQKIKTRIKFKQNFPNRESFERTLVASIIQQNNQSQKPVGGLIEYLKDRKNGQS